MCKYNFPMSQPVRQLVGRLVIVSSNTFKAYHMIGKFPNI